jgi:hypothetical protein
LIRETTSKGVIIAREPEMWIERPYAAEAFSLHAGTVMGLVKRWLDADREATADVRAYGLSIRQTSPTMRTWRAFGGCRS